MLLLLACSPPPPEPPAPEPPRVEVVRPVVSPRAEVGRDPVTAPSAVTPWGSTPPECTGRCVPLQTRVQASSVRNASEKGGVGEHWAADGDLTTAWCASGGAGQKLALSSGRPMTVRRILLAPWDGEGPAITALDVVTDRGDRVPVELDPPEGTLEALGGRPPAIDVLLEGVQFVQIEVRELQGPGDACIAEVALLGEP
ncbi:MAG: hypothetical protein H6736_02530 [Alphaproteobacteria bacterium]|nr:hypothetical protein [Alphaproteobacteria bacterium]